MKFTTFKELDTKIKEVTSKELLKHNIIVMSQGSEITFDYIGEGNTMGVTELSYMSNNTADSMRIKFTGDGDSISVSEIKVLRA